MVHLVSFLLAAFVILPVLSLPIPTRLPQNELSARGLDDVPVELLPHDPTELKAPIISPSTMLSNVENSMKIAWVNGHGIPPPRPGKLVELLPEQRRMLETEYRAGTRRTTSQVTAFQTRLQTKFQDPDYSLIVKHLISVPRDPKSALKAFMEATESSGSPPEESRSNRGVGT